MITAIWDFLFHRHEWETFEDAPFLDNGAKIGRVCFLRCKKCGNVKRKNLS